MAARGWVKEGKARGRCPLNPPKGTPLEPTLPNGQALMGIAPYLMGARGRAPCLAFPHPPQSRYRRISPVRGLDGSAPMRRGMRPAR